MALSVTKASPDFIVQLAQDYITEQTTTMALAKRHNSSRATIDALLFRGIAEGIIDELTACEVIRKAVSASRDEAKACERWEMASKLRKAKEIEEEITFLTQYIQKVGFALDRVSDYLAPNEADPAKRFIQRELSQSQSKLEHLQKRLSTLKG